MFLEQKISISEWSYDSVIWKFSFDRRNKLYLRVYSDLKKLNNNTVVQYYCFWCLLLKQMQPWWAEDNFQIIKIKLQTYQAQTI